MSGRTFHEPKHFDWLTPEELKAANTLPNYAKVNGRGYIVVACTHSELFLSDGISSFKVKWWDAHAFAI